jgi:radical SAM superfamily enzyme YgiQ (UPF0313 family)
MPTYAQAPLRVVNDQEPGGCRVLMIYPRFSANSFWNYVATCDLAGARYPSAPLGLITVAALLPRHWQVRLVNRNTETLQDADLDWADMVMVGGMLPQQPDALDLIELCRARGKPVVVGGPDATSTPDIYASADFLVLGEAEGIIAEFIQPGSWALARDGSRRPWARRTSPRARSRASICSSSTST